MNNLRKAVCVPLKFIYVTPVYFACQADGKSLRLSGKSKEKRKRYTSSLLTFLSFLFTCGFWRLGNSPLSINLSWNVHKTPHYIYIYVFFFPFYYSFFLQKSIARKYISINDFKLTRITKRKSEKSTQINTSKSTKIVSDGICYSKFFMLVYL